MRRRVWSAVLVLALLVGSACDDAETPTNPTPTPTPTTETFSGTLTVNGGVTFPFMSSQAGTVTATLTALGPNPVAVIGMAIGTWTVTTCQIILADDNASINSMVNGAVTTQGNLCLRIYDVGKIEAPVTFSVAVEHF